MLSLLACALTVGQAPIDQPTRLRTILPNGGIVLVEQVRSAKSLSLQIFLSARAGGTYGERHLLEHLMAVGGGDLDTRLESQGAFLNPRTLRPATCFSFDLPTGKLDLGLSAAKEILTPRAWPDQQIAREIRVINQEQALREWQGKVSDAAWKRVYGVAGSSAYELGKPSSDSLSALSKALVSPDNVTVVVSGNVLLDETTAKVKNLLETLSKANPLAQQEKKAGKPPSGAGELYAAPVPSFRSPKTAAVLSAALALAAQQKGATVTYTPSASQGLVILSKLGAPATANELFRDAKLLGRAWVQEHLASDPAFWRGFLMAQERDLRPETLRENIDAMTREQFAEGLELLVTSAIDADLPSESPLPSKEVPFVAEPVKLKPAGILEIVDPRQETISIQAVVALPKLSASERSLLPLLVHALPSGTQEYGRREVLMITAGAPIRAILMPDHIRVTFAVPRGGLSQGLSLMGSLLQSALLREEDLSGSAPETDAWAAALQPIFFGRPSGSSAQVRSLYQQVFRPEHITLAVGGPIKEGAAIEEWSKRTAVWQAPRLRDFRDDLSPKALQYTSVGSGVQAIQFSSPAPANLFPRMLALFALGSGKGSSLFRVVRQELGVSYRSEAVLSPSLTGFDTRLVILAEPGTEVAKVRGALLKDIDAWQDAERVRALGMAEAVIARGNGFSPFYLSDSEPVISDFEGRVFLAAYWQMKTGLAWNPTLMLTNLKDIPLAEMKEAAKEIVSGQAVVIG